MLRREVSLAQLILTRAVRAGACAAFLAAATLTMHAAETTNRLSSNRLAANELSANRLAANRLSSNRLSSNRLSSNHLESLPDTAEILQTADGREVYSYMMSCALPEGTSIEADIADAPDTAPPDTLYTCSGGHCAFPGSIGLAPQWIDRKLDLKGQRWVTACLLARVNHFGVTEIISMRGVAPQLSVTPEEAATYTLQEGAFYGNIFNPADQPLDWNACRGKDKAAGDPASSP